MLHQAAVIRSIKSQGQLFFSATRSNVSLSSNLNRLGWRCTLAVAKRSHSLIYIREYSRMGSAEGIKTFEPAHGLNGKDERVNNWGTPGPAAFDFRSVLHFLTWFPFQRSLCSKMPYMRCKNRCPFVCLLILPFASCLSFTAVARSSSFPSLVLILSR